MQSSPYGEVGTLPAGGYACVSIVDTGTGMSHAVMALALDPFFTTKEPGRGTGLGLSQVYGFISQSGGDVKMDSTEGEGTTINLYLPIVDADEDSSSEYSSGVSAETVLLVEDESDLPGAATQLFQSIGYEVVTAGNAADAIEILKNNPAIDILFSDIVMGHGMDGIDLAHLVKHDFPAIKIVLSSGFAPTTLRRGPNALNDFTFIPKPYRLADLATALRAS